MIGKLIAFNVPKTFMLAKNAFSTMVLHNYLGSTDLEQPHRSFEDLNGPKRQLLWERRLSFFEGHCQVCTLDHLFSSALVTNALPRSSGAKITMATPSIVNVSPAATANFQPPKALTFNVVEPDQASSLVVIDAVADVIWLVYMVHQHEGSVFQGIVRAPATMTKLQVHYDLSICGQKAALK